MKRLRDVARICDRWQMIVEASQAAAVELAAQTEPFVQRDAA